VDHERFLARPLRAGSQFRAADGDVRRSFHAEPDAAALHVQDVEDDLAVDHETLTDLAAEDEHNSLRGCLFIRLPFP
jgi:hypothetical protein